jgi:hypothetical protein
MAPKASGGESNCAQALAQIRDLREGGWRWSETTANLLLSPHDSAAHVWYDPVAGQLRFSAKVVAMMREMMRDGR